MTAQSCCYRDLQTYGIDAGDRHGSDDFGTAHDAMPNIDPSTGSYNHGMTQQADAKRACEYRLESVRNMSVFDEHRSRFH